jgi:hypothetical protein
VSDLWTAKALGFFAFHYRGVGDSVGSDLGLGKSGGQAKLRK